MESKPPARRALGGAARWLMLGLAGLCVLLGVIGLFLPVMPTVPFLIVAAWAASRSSPRLHDWLHQHPRFGRQLRDWNEAGVVPRRAKWITAVMMTSSATMMLVVVPARWSWAVLLAIAVMAVVLAWLWRRPEQRPPTA
ncbi:MAG TPA: YbaN family protein, partial [Rhodanobacter sp.]|nr:YbaN family protein [Rhodanobacter sp.]